MRQIAIYGKGGIGKSTVSGNISSALSLMNIKTAQIGCDPKADSVNLLTGGIFIETISDLIRKNGTSEAILEKAIFWGFNDILCMEAGGPIPGQGCAGRGVLNALELIVRYKLFEKHKIEFVLYDVLGDIVCGGFAQPVRQNFAEEVYIVTSGEYMSLWAANNIAGSLQLFAEQGLKVRSGGIIANLRNVDNEEFIIKSFAEKLNLPILAFIPRDNIVQKAEISGKTVVQAFNDSCQAKIYIDLAKNILKNSEKFIPQAMSKENLQKLY